MKLRVLWLVPPTLVHRITCDAAAAFEVAPVASIPEALLALRTSTFDAVVLSCVEPDSRLDDCILELRRTAPGTAVIVDCVRAAVSAAVHLTKLGAADVWAGQAPPGGAVEAIRAAVHTAHDSAESADAAQGTGWAGLVGHSEPMLRVFEIIRLIASRRSTVLITGETGTGKEMVARAIHCAGGRERMPFVAVNCAAIPENLIEAELFGHTKGAFTGAQQSRAGRFEQANGGTLFLDEVGELPLGVQVKLLRVLQEREVQRLGSNDTTKLNIRVIAATNVDLEAAVAARTFRQDLYYRLNVVPLRLPALRDRMTDLSLLVGHFLAKICAAERIPRKMVSPAALEMLSSCEWPGNVRQLEHAVEMAVVLSGERSVLNEHDFASIGSSPSVASSECVPLIRVPDEGLNFDYTVTSIERSILQQALSKAGGNKARAAEMLQMKRTTLLAKLKSLEDNDFGAARMPIRPPLSLANQRLFAAAG